MLAPESIQSDNHDDASAPKKRRLPKALRIVLIVVVCIGALFAVEHLSLYVTATSPAKQITLAVKEAMRDAAFAQDESPLKSTPDSGALYKTLPASEQHIYEELYKAVWIQEESISFYDVSDETICRIYDQMRYDHPELIHVMPDATVGTMTWDTLSSRSMVVLWPGYFWDKDQTDECRANLTAKIDRFIQDIPERFGEKEKANFIHQHFCKMVEYDGDDDDNTSSRHTAYGAICSGVAVCEGYALGYALLCQAAGLECETIVGTLSYIKDPMYAHAWNRVKIDGEWLYVDSTYDDGDTISFNYLLRPLEFMEAKGYTPYEMNARPWLDDDDDDDE